MHKNERISVQNLFYDQFDFCALPFITMYSVYLRRERIRIFSIIEINKLCAVLILLLSLWISPMQLIYSYCGNSWVGDGPTHSLACARM